MVIMTSSKDNISGEDIRITLNVLKKHIRHYDTVEKCMYSKQDLTRNRRIEELVMEEKHLAEQFRQVQKEIRRYEKKYEKILQKKVHMMSMQIKNDLCRLNILKRKYKELDAQISKNVKDKEPTRELPKKVCKVQSVKRGMRRFKQKSVPFNKKIKIRIKRNEKLGGRREMLFVNEGNTQQSMAKLVNVAKSTGLNTRECKIMLEKLTEEQVNRIIQHRQNQQQQNQPTSKQSSPNSSQKNNESETSDKPNWHIKIPKSVFEEIQKENHSPDVNVISLVRNVITRNQS